MTSYKKLKKPLAPQACPIYIAATGSLAQLVERFVYTEDVGSSSLSRPTILPIEAARTCRVGARQGRLGSAFAGMRIFTKRALDGARRCP